jgi:hypothetical protein
VFEKPPVIPALFSKQAVLPIPGDVARIIMFTGYGPIAGDGCPQAGKLNAFDWPEKDKAALIDKLDGPVNGGKLQARSGQILARAVFRKGSEVDSALAV